jgi:HAD superfamily hydrolase (TIGR01509 family)
MRSAVIFDLDGTITQPFLDFDRIRAEVGLPAGRPILEALDTLSESDRARAEAVLARHEQQAAEQSTLNPGARETIAGLRARGCPVAILTRNARHWTRFILEKHHIEVDLIRCREDGAIKPSPIPILEICQALDAEPQSTWVVGDHRFDMICGREAGARTVLLLSAPDRSHFAELADYVIHALPDLIPLVTLAKTPPR